MQPSVSRLLLAGFDFTCVPSAAKPITVATGHLQRGVLRVRQVEALPAWPAFEQWLQRPGPWLAAFDFPFGLPRVFVDELCLGRHLADVAAEVQRRCPARRDWRALIDGWGNGRPAGRRLPHRVCDRVAEGLSSTSPLQTRYVPVGLMFYEGLPRLLAAGVTLPGLHEGDAQRHALEGYPGLLAHALIGRRSYKNSVLPDRRVARADILRGLQQGSGRLGVPVHLAPALQQHLLDDASGDRLDAVLCLVQAAWAGLQPRYGQPAAVDAVEGWITSAQPC